MCYKRLQMNSQESQRRNIEYTAHLIKVQQWSTGDAVWPGQLSIEMADLLVQYHVRFDPGMGEHVRRELAGGVGGRDSGGTLSFRTRQQSECTAFSLVMPSLDSIHHMISVIPTGGMLVS